MTHLKLQGQNTYIVPIPRISVEDLKSKLDTENTASQPFILDVRLTYPYEHSTLKLPGAVRMDKIDTSKLPRNREIVAYDSDPYELVSSQIVGELIKKGFKATALKGGITAWLTAKFETETKSAPKQAPPIAGSLKG